MPFSRIQNKATLDCILRDVFEDDNDDGTPGDIRKALANDGALGFTNLGSMDTDQIAALSYTTDDDNTVVPIKRYQIGLIRTLKGYLFHKSKMGEPLLTMEDWDALDHDAFNSFRVSTSWMVLSETGLDSSLLSQPAAPLGVTGINPSGASFNPRPHDPVQEFKRGIKRDVQAYPDLKQDKGWDN